MTAGTNLTTINGSLVVTGSAVTFSANPTLGVGVITSTNTAASNNMILNASATGEAGIILQGNGSGKYQFYSNNSDNTLRIYNYTTAKESYRQTSAGVHNFFTGSSSAIGVIVQGSASQTANLQEWQDSAGTIQAYIANNGAAAFYSSFSVAQSTTSLAYTASQGMILTDGGVSYATFENPSWGGTGGFKLATSCSFYFSSTTAYTGTVDLGMKRSAAGVLEINNGTAGTYRDIKLRHVELVAGNIATDTTTGTKIATATTQKLAFWNATPIVQPTTAIAASTFAANTSGIADDTATFDGYTIGQVVKALRNAGLLA